MTALSITCSIDMTWNRAQGLAFDEVFSKFRNTLKSLQHVEETRKGFLSKVYVMFVFDPQAEVTLGAPRYNRRTNTAEADIHLTRGIPTGTAPQAYEAVLRSELVGALSCVRDCVEQKGIRHGISELMDAILGGQPCKGGNRAPAQEVEVTGVRVGAHRGRAMAGAVDRSQPSHQLVVQLPEDAFSASEDMFLLEERLAKSLGAMADVDGNDLGGGKFNVFMLTAHPRRAFMRIRTVLQEHGLLKHAKIAFKPLQQEEFTPLWPAGCKVPFEL